MMGPLTENDTHGEQKNNAAYTHWNGQLFISLQWPWSDLSQIINDCNVLRFVTRCVCVCVWACTLVSYKGRKDKGQSNSITEIKNLFRLPFTCYVYILLNVNSHACDSIIFRFITSNVVFPTDLWLKAVCVGFINMKWWSHAMLYIIYYRAWFFTFCCING